MARPVRSASRRALELIAAGYNVKRVDSIGAEGLTAEEEDALNREISGEDMMDLCAIDQNEDSDSVTAADGTGQKPIFSTYEDLDVEPSVIKFRPCKPPGLHLTDRITRSGINKFTKAIDFFQLFITDELLEMIVENTNLYGWLHIHDKPSYGRRRDGAWEETCVREIKLLLAFLLFNGFNGRRDIERTWSQATMYSGGWAQRFLSKNRYKALSAMLHVSRPGEEDESDKLAKIRPMLTHMREVCSKYFQPIQTISIDERMVPSKGRSPIQQYMPSKLSRYGYKLWCMCDARSGYTYDFSVYIGKREKKSAHGLGFDVITSLMEPHMNQGYVVYCDSFFSSLPLAKHLLSQGTYMCGTMQHWRRGYPTVLKSKEWVKNAKCGDMRYVRQDAALLLQWQDKQPVHMISTLHRGHNHGMAFRRGKNKQGDYQPKIVRIPTCIQSYNRCMGGVDLADQMLASYACLTKVTRWWKTLFFHMLDLATLNSYLLFKMWRQAHPEIPGLSRRAGFSHLSFREELARQLARIRDDEPPPLYMPALKRRKSLICDGPHDPCVTDVRRNCRVCYLRSGKQNKSYTMCADEQCRVHLCLSKKRNCFPLWHSPDFDAFRNLKKK